MLHKNLKPFHKDFLWGASTSAYQVEGANLEDGLGLDNESYTVNVEYQGKKINIKLP